MEDRGYNTKEKKSKLKKKNRGGARNLSFELLQSLRIKKEQSPEEEELMRDLNQLYPLFGLQQALKRIHKGDPVEEDLNVVAAFVDTFATVKVIFWAETIATSFTFLFCSSSCICKE